MTAHITKDWWVCLCDRKGNVRHLTVREWLGANRLDLMQGSEESLPVALASTLEGCQEAGRTVKREMGERERGAKEQRHRGSEGQRSEGRGRVDG